MYHTRKTMNHVWRQASVFSELLQCLGEAIGCGHFKDQSFGFKTWGLGFRVLSLRFRV